MARAAVCSSVFQEICELLDLRASFGVPDAHVYPRLRMWYYFSCIAQLRDNLSRTTQSCNFPLERSKGIQSKISAVLRKQGQSKNPALLLSERISYFSRSRDPLRPPAPAVFLCYRSSSVPSVSCLLALSCLSCEPLSTDGPL